MIWDGDEQGIQADEAMDVVTIENTSIDGIQDAGGRGIYAENSTVTTQCMGRNINGPAVSSRPPPPRIKSDR